MRRMSMKEVDAELDTWAVLRRDRLLALGWPAQSNLKNVIELGYTDAPGYGNPTQATLMNRRVRDFMYSETAIHRLSGRDRQVIIAAYICRDADHRRLPQDKSAQHYGAPKSTFEKHLREAKEHFRDERERLTKPQDAVACETA